MYKMNVTTAHEKLDQMGKEIDSYWIDRIASRNAWQMSLASKDPYRWWNQWWALFWKFREQYVSNTRWTFLWIQKLGGSVLKWEKGITMIKFEIGRKLEEVLTPTWKEHRLRTRPMYFGHTVFNLDQTTLKENECPQYDLWLKDIDEFIDLYKDKPTEKYWPQPCYIPSIDTAYWPLETDFKNRYLHRHTRVHELFHSTGHSSRGNRDGVMGRHKFGSPEYIKEEARTEYATMWGCILWWIADHCKDDFLSYSHWWYEQAKKVGLSIRDILSAQNDWHYMIDCRTKGNRKLPRWNGVEKDLQKEAETL